MLRPRRLLSLLLFGALLLPQAWRSGAFGCESIAAAAAGVTFIQAQEHSRPVSDTGCPRHHPGTDPLPAGMQHCEMSLACTSMPALPVAGPDSHETVVLVTVREAMLHLLTSSSPEPQAPPPRV